MTASRDFGAPRNASFWGTPVVSNVCDAGRGDDAHPRGSAERIPIRGATAAAARATAREAGWLTGVKNPNGRPLDYCPEHRQVGDG